MAKLKLMHLAKNGSIFNYKRLLPTHFVAAVVADASRLADWQSGLHCRKLSILVLNQDSQWFAYNRGSLVRCDKYRALTVKKTDFGILR